MNERIRFHLDENVTPAIAIGLRRYGIDVTTTVEAGLRGTPDEAQLEFARKTGRIIVTAECGQRRLRRFICEAVSFRTAEYC